MNNDIQEQTVIMAIPPNDSWYKWLLDRYVFGWISLFYFIKETSAGWFFTTLFAFVLNFFVIILYEFSQLMNNNTLIYYNTKSKKTVS